MNRADKPVEFDHVAEKDTEQPEVRTGLARLLRPARALRLPVDERSFGVLRLRLELGVRVLGVAQLGDSREHDFPVTKRDAEFLQVGAVQVRQGAKVDVVFGKDLGIFA